MGKYISTLGPERPYSFGGSFYLGGSTPKNRRLVRIATRGSWPYRLSWRYDIVNIDERDIRGAFLTTFLGVVISLTIAGAVSAASVLAAWIVAVALVSLSALPVVFVILCGIYYVVGGVTQKLCRDSSVWERKLTEQPAVAKLTGSNVRPAVRALDDGDPSWFEKHGDEYGDVIDEFLNDPAIKQLEKHLNKEGIEDAMRLEADHELQRIAAGSVRNHVALIEGAKAEAAASRAADEAMREKAHAQAANEALGEFLNNEIKPIVTTSEV